MIPGWMLYFCTCHARRHPFCAVCHARRFYFCIEHRRKFRLAEVCTCCSCSGNRFYRGNVTKCCLKSLDCCFRKNSEITIKKMHIFNKKKVLNERWILNGEFLVQNEITTGSFDLLTKYSNDLEYIKRPFDVIVSILSVRRSLSLLPLEGNWEILWRKERLSSAFQGSRRTIRLLWLSCSFRKWCKQNQRPVRISFSWFSGIQLIK